VTHVGHRRGDLSETSLESVRPQLKRIGPGRRGAPRDEPRADSAASVVDEIASLVIEYAE